jgi:hypothetical protein
VEQVALVRCFLDGADEATTLRYVPVAEFELWRHLMETRHGRSVSVDSVSVWIAEQSAWWNSGFTAEDLVPVLRLRFERIQEGVPAVMERFFAAETYPEAQEALLSHFGEGQRVRPLSATPGYFVPAAARQRPIVRPA